MRKGWLIGLFSLLASLPAVLADAFETLDNTWNTVVSKIGNLGFLGLTDTVMVTGFTRILVGLLVFTILFGVMTGFEQLKFLNRKQAGIVAAIIAVITAIFLPPVVLLTAGGSWAIIVGLLLIAGPVIGLSVLLWKIPFGEDPETKFTVLLKLVLVLILTWVLSAVKNNMANLVGSEAAGSYVSVITSVNEFASYGLSILTLMIIYYVIKFFIVGKPTPEEESEMKKRREGLKGFLDERKQAAEKKKAAKKKETEKAEKKDMVSPIKKNIRVAIEACDETILHLDNKRLKDVRKTAKVFEGELRNAWTNLRLLRKNSKGKDRDAAQKMIYEIEAIREKVNQELKGKLPKNIGKDWANQIKAVRDSLKNIRGSVGNIFKRLEKFHG